MRQRDFHTGRSAVYAESGAAATAHPAATLAAIDVLRAGGNAVDAAITAHALLAVIEPQSTGIGGDGFVILSKDGAAPIGLNGSGRAPAAATLEWYREQGIAEIVSTTPHAVTVPGAVDAWCRLAEDHGTRSIEELLQPAITAAADGYLVTPRVAYDWQNAAAKLAGDPDAAAIYLPGGRAPAAGDRHRQEALAGTLRTIGRKGRDGFYRGPVAEDIVAKLRSLGGLHTEDDFAGNTPSYVEPIRSSYRGHDVYEIPPNGQGVTVQVILNVLQDYDFGRLGLADRFHLMAEAAKAAYARRNALIGDPDFVDVPTDRLRSLEEAERIRRHIRMDRAAPWPEVEGLVHSDTTYLCVVDRDRTSVSFINSLFAGFGSGITAPQSGVVLQNRGASFRLIDGHPNAIAPGKRPMHTIIPGLLAKGGRTVMPFGVMGGHYQPVGHAQLLTGMLDLDLDPQEALEAPRAFANADQLEVEPTVPLAVAEDLAGRGHRVVPADGPHGGGQAIWIDHERGVLIAGSEPRKDGCALGY
ncbi:gamma-glutamyltransferase [Marinivivus vitaminiproducens]|nr:gamma-glutamyltransferase [Geminicoccaceae bacterium SCSIO 64248]